MRYTIAELLDTYKRKASIEKFVTELMAKAKQDAYENRKVIDKREVEYELSKIACIPELWSKFKKLRKTNDNYDAIIFIDDKGYTKIKLRFPITEKEYQKARAARTRFIEKNGPFASVCVRMPEEVYKVCHKRIEKVFKDYSMCAYDSYDKVSTFVLVRWVEFNGIKK